MRVLTLSRLTLQEMIYDKIFIVVLVLAGLVIALSFALGALSFSEQQKIVADFGFLAVELACCLIASFGGSYMISREIEKQTCLLILSRPVSRGEFIVAKYLGVLILNLIVAFSLGLLLGALLQLWNQPNQIGHLAIIILSLWLKAAILGGIAFVFSLLVRPMISLMFTLVVYLLGHWLEDMKFFAEKFHDDGIKTLVNIFDWICPNFYRMNWKSWFFLEKGPGSLEVGWMIVHSLGWILIMLFLMQVLFRRKDIV
jgi:ABC-type transport system involved in multi-copper enzyme maturation permease subunit